ncbi:hypothetical protein QE377_002921 [Microbacterium sp. SORGH_AS 862]|nr:hypothetical protein [Microbacterium sp. SORGH_AS_0862]
MRARHGRVGRFLWLNQLGGFGTTLLLIWYAMLTA